MRFRISSIHEIPGASVILGILLCGFVGMSGRAASPSSGPAGSDPAPRISEETVRHHLRRTYIHGVDDDLARTVLGPGAVPILRRLLFDPEFPRRDNVVAFLAHLDSGSATSDLLGFLSRPPASLEHPAEDRALLLAPGALGLIARRGGGAALEALLEMTAPGGGRILRRAASFSRRPAVLFTDLIRMSMRGLALSCDPRAWDRLIEIGTDPTRFHPGGVDLSRSAEQYRKLFSNECDGVAPEQAATGEESVGEDGRTQGGGFLETGGGEGGSANDPSGDESSGAVLKTEFSIGVLDSHLQVQDAALTYANHVDLQVTMTDMELDDLLRAGSLRVGRSEFAIDVACCYTISRSGPGEVFGEPGDGLDIIDDASELNSVLTDKAARAKVVRAILFCGGQVTNAAGCATVAGKGMAVIRTDDDEAGLWVHEFGHNAGLTHNPDERYLMFRAATGINDGLTVDECSHLHNPARRSKIDLQDIGVCEDIDGDFTQDLIDNCPLDENHDQLDSDGDGIGDACDDDRDGDGVSNDLDLCPDIPDPDQLNADGDGLGDLCDPCPGDPGNDADHDGFCADSDNCPEITNPNQLDLDGDQIGNPCDNCPTVFNPLQADSDNDGEGDLCDGDKDGDGILDDIDVCPTVPDPAQLDSDGDGVGDACDLCVMDPMNDADGDGLCAGQDNCSETANADQSDTDLDGRGDVCDNCALTPNLDQLDSDADGLGDACDICPLAFDPEQADGDLDGAGDLCDNCPTTSNPAQGDLDGDGTGDLCDLDRDGDGVVNINDICPDLSDPEQVDTDGDGMGDVCDACPLDPGNDEDGDGLCSSEDNCALLNNPGQEDTDFDGVGDPCDNCALAPNSLQDDSDGDGLGDVCDNCPLVSNVVQSDFDSDGEGDPCDLDDGLLLFTNVSESSLSWQEEIPYQIFHLYRGDLGLLLSSGEYTQDPASTAGAARACNLFEPSALEETIPAPGTAFFYLASGFANGMEDLLGLDSSGTERPNTLPCELLPPSHTFGTADPIISTCGEVIELQGQVLGEAGLPLGEVEVAFEIVETVPAGLSSSFNPDTLLADETGSYSVSFKLKKRDCDKQCSAEEPCTMTLRATSSDLESNEVLVSTGL